MSELFTITGATGNIGRKVVESLLEKGHRVRAIGRNPNNLKPLTEKGAEAVVANLDNALEISKAFHGAKAVFAIIPPNYSADNMRAYQNKIGEALDSAISMSEVKYVVNLSSFGAHLPEKTGPVMGVRDQEERLNKMRGVHILHLRPGYFMENLLINVGIIKSMNIMGTPLQSDTPIPMIATKDIAAVVVESLMSAAFSGKSTRELLGPRDITMKEVAKAVGKAINRPDLPYVQFPYAEAEKAMTQMGLSPDTARLMIEFQKSLNEGYMKSAEKRSSENTTPTTIDRFAEEVFLPAFKGDKISV